MSVGVYLYGLEDGVAQTLVGVWRVLGLDPPRGQKALFGCAAHNLRERYEIFRNQETYKGAWFF